MSKPRRSERLQKKRKTDDPKKDSPPNTPNNMNTPTQNENFMRFFIINMPPPFSDEEEEPEEEEEDVQGFGPEMPVEKIRITIKINKIFETLKELIDLGETYDPSFEYESNIDMQKLHAIVEPLKELDAMIGLKKFKRSIIDQIVYLLTLKNEKPMLHTCIYGSPGCGKTETAKILGKIYSSCGFLSSNSFKVIKREDLVAQYMGHSAIKTKKFLESMKGGVVFLDEAYSLGSNENRDYFAKEAIDTLNAFLSENYNDFVFIIAGYEKEIKKCFFAQNPGLDRRFPYRFTIDTYSPKELGSIFEKFVKDSQWTVDVSDLDKFFIENMGSFPNFGGDVKSFLDKSEWKKLSKEDIVAGFDLYLEERQIVKDSISHMNMYI